MDDKIHLPPHVEYVDLYIDGRYWGRSSAEAFENDWNAGSPIREVMRREFETLKKEMGL